jgi:hypothetical protein
MNGRNANDLITPSGAAVTVGNNTAQHGLQGNPLIAVAGGNEFGVEYNLDGAQHISFFDSFGGRPPRWPGGTERHRTRPPAAEPPRAVLRRLRSAGSGQAQPFMDFGWPQTNAADNNSSRVG